MFDPMPEVVNWRVLRTVSTSAPTVEPACRAKYLDLGHLRYGDLEEAAGAADAVELWVLLGRFEVCSCP